MIPQEHLQHLAEMYAEMNGLQFLRFEGETAFFIDFEELGEEIHNLEDLNILIEILEWKCDKIDAKYSIGSGSVIIYIKMNIVVMVDREDKELATAIASALYKIKE